MVDVERVVAQHLPRGFEQAWRADGGVEQRRRGRAIGLVDAVDGFGDAAAALPHQVVGVDALYPREFALHGCDLGGGEQAGQHEEAVALVLIELRASELHGVPPNSIAS